VVARPDVLWRSGRVVGEYDGDQHRTDRTAWQYERERRAGIEDEGWTYVELTSLSFTGERECRALRARLTRLLG
jgi:very-short-patch-repair endonuclease